MAKTELYDIAKIAALYLQPVVFVSGLLGNVLSFFVFLSAPMKKFSSNVYLAALSFCNCGFSLLLLLQWLEMVGFPVVSKQGFCQTIVYLSYVFSFLCAWFVVCIAVESYIIAFHMSKAAVWCTVIRAKVVIALLALFSLALYSGMPRVTAVLLDNENNTVCTVVEEHSEVDTIYFFLDAALTIALPMLVTAILIGAVVLKKQCSTSSSLTPARQRKSNKTLSKITKVLVVIAITYVVLNAPSFINKARLLILTELYGKQYDMPDILLQQIFQLVSYLSVCAHVLCYIAFSRNFRKGARKLLYCI